MNILPYSYSILLKSFFNIFPVLYRFFSWNGSAREYDIVSWIKAEWQIPVNYPCQDRSFLSLIAGAHNKIISPIFIHIFEPFFYQISISDYFDICKINDF